MSFGEMLLFIRRSIRKGVKINRDVDDDCLEVILDKCCFFGFPKNVKILFTYASPLNSPYTKARSETVLEKIETYIDDGRCSFFIMGDLNGRTKKEEDFVRDSADKHSPIGDIPGYITDTQMNRNNRDIHCPNLDKGCMSIERPQITPYHL